jgi:UDP-glucuronate 4-epimerase
MHWRMASTGDNLRPQVRLERAFMHILLTGAAGFIGAHVAQRLLARGDQVIALDCFNDYYDPALKRARVAHLLAGQQPTWHELDVADAPALERALANQPIDRVIHLAAQAGVRYSLQNPQAYGQANLLGFLNILELCHQRKVAHLVYASSSSVYGGNTRLPFAETDAVGHPVSLYAATKRANELMAHSYSHLYGLPTTGLRFFTVYGPWGRPDMAYFSFTRDILAGQPIQLFNEGRMLRDFTYIDDIVDGVIAALDRPATPAADFDRAAPRADQSWAPYRLFNIGGDKPQALEALIGGLERTIGRPAQRVLLPMQAGDVTATHADAQALHAWTGQHPHVSLEEGLGRFVAWYRQHYGV